MKQILGALSIAAVMAASTVVQAQDIVLQALFMKQTAYSDKDVRDMTNDFEAAHPGIKVNLEFVPYEALHNKIVASISAGSGGYDVALVDTIWPAEFATNQFVDDLTSLVPPRDPIFGGAWKTGEYDGKIWAMPWILDTKYLFYNKDILAKAGFDHPPATLDELTQQAKVIKDKGLADYPIVWSWGQAEALVCDYALLVQAFGGQFYDESGEPAFTKGGALKALQFMVGSIKDGISNPRSTEFLEEEVRNTFSSGRAAFALNWTYMWPLANDPKQSEVSGKIGIVPAPGTPEGSPQAAINGSMGLSIMRNSDKKDAAWQYIKYLTSQETQDKYASMSLPIWKSSYADPKVVKGQEELIKAAETSVAIMYNRPTKVQYQEISTLLQQQIQSALLGLQSPEQAMKDLASQTSGMK